MTENEIGSLANLFTIDQQKTWLYYQFWGSVNERWDCQNNKWLYRLNLGVFVTPCEVLGFCCRAAD